MDEGALRESKVSEWHADLHRGVRYAVETPEPEGGTMGANRSRSTCKYCREKSRFPVARPAIDLIDPHVELNPSPDVELMLDSLLIDPQIQDLTPCDQKPLLLGESNQLWILQSHPPTPSVSIPPLLPSPY
jgi:hypothetical protein